MELIGFDCDLMIATNGCVNITAFRIFVGLDSVPIFVGPGRQLAFLTEQCSLTHRFRGRKFQQGLACPAHPERHSETWEELAQ